MKRNVLSALSGLAIVTIASTAGAQTFSTPAYNGTGAAASPYTNHQTSTNFNSSLGQNLGTALGTSLGTNIGTATTPGNPALGQPTTVLGQQGTTALGQQNTTAIGQQGVGTAIIPPGTTNAASSTTGSALTPGVAGQASTNPPAGTITNGFIVNSDGTVTALPGAGSTAAGNFGGTNTGAGSSVQTPGQGVVPQTQTNSQRNP